MSHESTPADIDAEVARMQASKLNAIIVRRTLGMLRLRAASVARWRELAALSNFHSAAIGRQGITTEVRLTRPAT
jgi:hypothetical protein